MGVFVIIWSLPFAHVWNFSRIFINLRRQHLHVGSRGRDKGIEEEESSHYHWGPQGGPWRWKCCIMVRSIWLFSSDMRLPLRTSFLSPNNSTPCLCCSVLILSTSVCIHAHLSFSKFPPVSWSWYFSSWCHCLDLGLTCLIFWWRLGFGKILGGKGWFSYGIKV